MEFIYIFVPVKTDGTLYGVNYLTACPDDVITAFTLQCSRHRVTSCQSCVMTIKNVEFWRQKLRSKRAEI